MIRKKKIGFIGAGNMAYALIKGILKANVTISNRIIASDINEVRLRYIEKETEVKVTLSNEETVRFSDIIILAIKPQIINEVLSPLKKFFNPSKTLISILAGIKIKKIEKIISSKQPIIRVMPNISALVQESASAICFNSNCTTEDIKIAFSLFNSIGRTIEVDESLMNVVTGLSGSGPGYIFVIIKALKNAGIKMGLSEETSTILAAQTVLGAGRMVLETKEDPSSLKNRVTSPKGTTFAGLEILEKAKIEEIIITAVIAATKRAFELSK